MTYADCCWEEPRSSPSMSWWHCVRKRIPSHALSISARVEPTTSAIPQAMYTHAPQPPLLSPTRHRIVLARSHTRMLWTLAPLGEGEKSRRRNGLRGYVRVDACTAVDWDIWLATVPTKLRTPSVLLLPRWSSSRIPRRITRTRIRLRTQFLSVAVAEEEIGVVMGVGAKARREMLRPTAA
jgi:hypothetical protein